MTDRDYTSVLRFWFEELSPQAHWRKDPDVDNSIRNFMPIHEAVSAGECFEWRDTAEGALAEVIVLDQFSRNLFRDTSRAFAYDGMALVLAQEAVAKGLDKVLDTYRRSFFYMPYMHSESPFIHEQAVKLFGTPGLENSLDFELRHQRIILRFGRYPHRNAALGRESTAEETAFLKLPGSGF